MKRFIKDISIYSILPVVGKFLGLILFVVYARSFDLYQFGRLDMIIALESFLVYFINLEFYTALGKIFYNKQTIKEKSVLISTGLFLTIIAACFIMLILCVVDKYIVEFYLNDISSLYEVRISFIWLVLEGIGIYLITIQRYLREAKLYVFINIISIVVRVIFTLIFILFFNLGIVGVLYGYICGAIVLIGLNLFFIKKFLILAFSKVDAESICNFAFPMVPSVILIASCGPLFRWGISECFSVKVVGLYAFASRITSFFSVLVSVLRNAWLPILFERGNSKTFFYELRKVSTRILLFVLFIGSLVVLFAKEICLFLGSDEYLCAYVFFPFLIFIGYLRISMELRGVGPMLFNKTKWYSFSVVISLFICSFLFFLIKNDFGILGIGFVLVLFYLIQHIILYHKTKETTGTLFFAKEFLFLFIFSIVCLLVLCDVCLLFRVLLALFFICCVLVRKRFLSF